MCKLVNEFNGFKVGDIIHNDNDYMVVAINPELDRTLLVKLNAKAPYYVGAWGLTKNKNGNDYYWCQGHYFMEHLDSAINYVMDKEDN